MSKRTKSPGVSSVREQCDRAVLIAVGSADASTLETMRQRVAPDEPSIDAVLVMLETDGLIERNARDGPVLGRRLRLSGGGPGALGDKPPWKMTQKGMDALRRGM